MNLETLLGDAGIFPQRLDARAGRVLFVRLGEARMREAAFLDDRVLDDGILASWLPLAALSDPRLPDRSPPLWIFHIGHCGSTLLSRLLPEVAPLLPVREPMVLRSLADALRRSDPGHGEWQRLFGLLVPLLARSFDPGQAALIKATSDCNNLIPAALAHDPASRAVLMSVSLRSYLATMIVDGAPRPDVDGHVVSRLRDLRPFVDAPDLPAPEALSPAQRTAVCWLSGVAQLAQAGETLGSRIIPLDFDAFLERLPESLAEVVRLLGLHYEESAVRRAVDGPIMRSNAKAPGSPYTPAFRAARLEENYARASDMIDGALRWADDMAARHPRLGTAVARFTLDGKAGSG